MGFDYQFTCEKCGRRFYSKVDTSTWRHHICNGCSGKPYKDYPVEGGIVTPTYQPRPVPTQISNNVQPVQVAKQEFNLSEYIADMLVVFVTLRDEIDRAGLTIPVDNICNWTTSIMIQKGKAKIGD